MNYLVKLAVFLVFLCSGFSLDAKEMAFSILNQKFFYDIKSDFTYESSEEVEYEILSQEGIALLKQISYTYHPSSETFEAVHAYSLSPDGQKTTLTLENIFTRTSQASEDAPGFSSSLTTTFVFPHLQVGSRIFLSTRLSVVSPPFPGFSLSLKAPWACGAKNFEISFKLPPQSSFYFKWVALGGVQVEDKEVQGTRYIKTQLKNFPAIDKESFMVFPKDFPPSFTASTFKSWEEIGIFYAEAERKITEPGQGKPSFSPDNLITKSDGSLKNPQLKPDYALELKNLSNQIVGSKKGKRAAEALYQWVCNHITYVALFLDFKDGFVPHHPYTVLVNRYGDCKDKAVLLKTLLKFQGIKAYSTLISSTPGQDPPLPCESYFDHMILYLPEFNVFLDPTQIYSTFGEIGPSLADHLVALATPEGTVFRTAKAQADQNLYTAHSDLSLQSDGTIHGKYFLETTGSSSTELRSFFSTPFTTQEGFARNILLSTPEGGAGVISITSSLQDLIDPAKAQGEWVIPKGFTLDKSVFLPIPYGLDMRLSLPFMRGYFTAQSRKFPFEAVPGIDTWTYTVKLPEEAEVFYLPLGQSLTNSAGQYVSTYTQVKDQIQIKRIFILNKQLYDSKEQKEFMDLIELMLLDLRQPLGIQKKSPSFTSFFSRIKSLFGRNKSPQKEPSLP